MISQPLLKTTEDEIAGFWEAHQCGDQLVAGMADDYTRSFSEHDAFRYGTEAHLPRCLDALAPGGKRTLEIGLGQGADSEQLIRRGAIWSGLDLSRESVLRVRFRLQLHNLTYETIEQGSVLDIPYATASFDLVYSHGVLHHVPDIRRAQKEIRRVSKPDGTLNYLLSICLLQRLGLLVLGLRKGASGIYGEHLAMARQQGLIRFLRMRNFIHRNTDGPDSPYRRFTRSPRCVGIFRRSGSSKPARNSCTPHRSPFTAGRDRGFLVGTFGCTWCRVE